jgi:hypothetical protein
MARMGETWRGRGGGAIRAIRAIRGSKPFLTWRGVGGAVVLIRKAGGCGVLDARQEDGGPSRSTGSGRALSSGRQVFVIRSCRDIRAIRDIRGSKPFLTWRGVGEAVVLIRKAGGGCGVLDGDRDIHTRHSYGNWGVNIIIVGASGARRGGGVPPEIPPTKRLAWGLSRRSTFLL